MRFGPTRALAAAAFCLALSACDTGGVTAAPQAGGPQPEEGAAATPAPVGEAPVEQVPADAAPAVPQAPDGAAPGTPAPSGSATGSCGPGTGTGTTYHVSPSGDDTNPGTAQAPFRTVGRATQLPGLAPGDTVLVGAGTYAERVVLGASGSADGGCITLRGVPGAVLAHPDPDPSTVWDDGTVFARGVSYWDITGLTIDGSAWGAITMAGTSHVVVRGNTVTDAGASCIIFYPDFDRLRALGLGEGEAEVMSSDITVTGNTLRNCNAGYPGGGAIEGGQEALSIWGVDRFEVAHNEVDGCTREGIDAKNGARNGSIHHNVVRGCASVSGTAAGYNGGAALYVEGSRADVVNIDVHSNVVTDNVADAIVVTDEVPQAGDVRDVRVWDNVITGNGVQGQNGGACLIVGAGTTDVVAERNTCAGNVQSVVVDRGYGGYPARGVVIDRNVLAGDTYRLCALGDAQSVRFTDNVVTTGHATTCQVQGAPVADLVVSGTLPVATAPFRDAAAGDHRLTDPALDAGADLDPATVGPAAAPR